MATRNSTLWPTEQQRHLMRASLLDGDAALPAFRTWKECTVFDDIDSASFRVLPLLRWNLRRLGVDDPLMARLDSVSRYLLVETTMKLESLRKLVEALADAGIPRMLLKGAATGQRYYPGVFLRTMSDCDVLVPRHQAEEGLRALTARGWRMHDADAAPIYHSRTLWIPPFQQMEFDYHWASSEQSTVRDDRVAWEEAELFEFRGVQCNAMCVEDEIIHACRHGLSWSPMPPFRWLLDCAIIVRARNGMIDWDKLAKRARDGEATLCVRRSLEWIRRELNSPVPAEALQKLREQGTTRRERRTYVLKTKAKHWTDFARLFYEYLDRELPPWQWPLHPRRVMNHFAAHFNLPDHADILRYTACHLRQLAEAAGRTGLSDLLEIVALKLGCKPMSNKLLPVGFTGVVDEPSGLCWPRRKIRLQGFVFTHDGTPQPPMRVTHEGRVLAGFNGGMLRPDIAEIELWKSFPSTLKSGFMALFNLPSRKCKLLIEYRREDNWLPMFDVLIGCDESYTGFPAMYEWPFQMRLNDPANERFLGPGWSMPESSGRWSDGPRAELKFSLPDVRLVTMSMCLSPFLVPGKHETQRVVISLNGRRIGTLKLNKNSLWIQKVRLPRRAVADNNTLVFEFPDAAIPSSLGVSNDPRQLGISVEWIEFHETGAKRLPGNVQALKAT